MCFLNMIFSLYLYLQNFKRFVTDKEFFKETLIRVVSPTEDWGPALPEIRRKFSYSGSRRTGSVSQSHYEDDDVFEPARGTEMATRNNDHAHVSYT